MRRISTDLGRARAPTSPFEAPEGWRLIERLADLWQVGRTMSNCVGSLGDGGESHMEQFVEGRAVFLVNDNPPVMLASILSVGPSLWVIDEMKAEKRSDVIAAREDLQRALAVNMAKIDHTLLDAAPYHAFQVLAWRSKRGKVDEIEDESEVATD